MKMFNAPMLVLVLLTNLLVNLSATEMDPPKEGDPLKDIQDSRVQEPGTMARTRKREMLSFPSFLKPDLKGKVSVNYYDKMPDEYSSLFEKTIYVETFLFCTIVLYGILHLPFWVTLYEKLKKSEPETPTAPTITEEIEMKKTISSDVKEKQRDPLLMYIRNDEF